MYPPLLFEEGAEEVPRLHVDFLQHNVTYLRGLSTNNNIFWTALMF
jgi:hypothetical protein